MVGPSIRVYARTYDEDMEHRWSVVDRMLQNLGDLCKLHNFDVIVMNAPVRERLDEDVLKAWGLGSVAYDPNKPNRMLKSLADKHDMIHILLYTELRREALRGGNLYWTADGHWTDNGHQLVGKVLYNSHIKMKYCLNRCPCFTEAGPVRSRFR